MGVATNQIATKGDLMKCGYTEISTSLTNTECATYGDIHDMVTNGYIASSVESWSSISPTINMTQTELNITLPRYGTSMYKLMTYSLPESLKASGLIYLSFSGSALLEIMGSSGSYNLTYYLCFGDRTPHESGSYEAGNYSNVQTGTTMYAYPISTMSISGDFSNYSTVSLYVVLENPNYNYISLDLLVSLHSYDALKYIPLDKCIKYGVASAQAIRVPWTLGINEQVAGKTNASQVIVRYAYKTSSTGTETYVTAGSVTMSDPDTANGTFSQINHIEYNVRKLKVAAPYSARMTLWCGSTKGNQTWSYRIKKRNGAWTSWSSTSNGKNMHVDPLIDFPELLTSNPYSSLSGGEAKWLQAAYAIRGVEFRID